jgi:hypothetical protein
MEMLKKFLFDSDCFNSAFEVEFFKMLLLIVWLAKRSYASYISMPEQQNCLLKAKKKTLFDHLLQTAL